MAAVTVTALVERSIWFFWDCVAIAGKQNVFGQFERQRLI
jgi:hypothetical protein